MFDTGSSLISLAPPVYQIFLKVLDDTGLCWIPPAGDDNSLPICYCNETSIAQYPNLTFYAIDVAWDVTPRQYLLTPNQYDVKYPLCLRIIFLG